MPPRPRVKEFTCRRCGQGFSSIMRLQHHRAAEHDPRTGKDIPTMQDVPTQRHIPHLIGTRGGVR